MKWIKRGNASNLEQVFLDHIGVKSLQDVNEWFIKSYAKGYRIERLTEAVALAQRYKDKNVAICGDYDTDGMTSTAILYLAFKWAGFSHVSYRIPKRFTEGFGINEKMVDEIEDGLLITCDNGVAQIEEVRKAKEKGLTVIVIDHHEPVIENGELILPPADIVIDPNAIKGSADFDGYCGAGLSYRFACELLQYNKPLTRKLEALAAIGTVADVMNLREENYVIVRNGIKMLNCIETCTVGSYSLVSNFGLNGHLTATDIGFKIAPALNAASRMADDGAKDGVELLIYEGPYENAVYMSTRLQEINNERKKKSKEGLESAKEVIKQEKLEQTCPLVVYLPHICEGIIGIIASNLCDEYKVPVIVLSDSSKSGILKGSGRSCGNYHMKKKLDEVTHLLQEYGGHEGAAGLSLKADNVQSFREALISRSADYQFTVTDNVYYDLEIKANEVPCIIDELAKYEPFGQGNEMPNFLITDFIPLNKYGTVLNNIGTDGVKLHSASACAVGFGMKDKLVNVSESNTMNLVGSLSNNYWNGNVTRQILFTDFNIT